MTPKELSEKYAKLIAANERRLTVAGQDHDRLLREQRAGRQAAGYRAEWISKTSFKLVSFLGEECQAFDQKYLADRASADDCLTILLTTFNLFLSRAGKRLEADGLTFRIVGA